MISNIRQIDQLVMEISKERLLEAFLDINNINGICSKLNISRYEYSKLIDFYQINELKYRSDARKRTTINQYFDIVDILGKHPSSADMQTNSNWQGVYTKIRKIWGGAESFRLEYGIERPSRKIILSRNKKSLKDEIASFYKIAEENNSIALKIYINEISKLKDHSIIKENVLLNKISNGSKRARNILIKGELINVIRIAQNCLIHNVDFADLIQEGNIGLLVSIDKFFKKTHRNFKGYSSLWIYQKVIRFLMESSSIIRIPVHIGEKVFVLKKYLKDNYISKVNKNNIDKISKDTGLSVELIDKIINIPKRISFKELKALESKTEYIDTAFDVCSQNNLKENIDLLLQSLDEREVKILNLRFGIDGENPKTLEEVGKLFNVTRERIRQIEAKALRKLRHPSRRKKLVDFY